jgi:hypothetical protein
MDKIAKYKKAVENLLKTYHRDSSTVETIIVVDNEQLHYQIIEAGWQDADRYFYGILFHIHINSKGKVVILENNTEDELTEDLINLGVEKSDILLNFLPERVRKHTGFAVA